MADNVPIGPGGGGATANVNVSTDEAVSGHLQRVKLAYSADGVDTHITADVSGLLVQLMRPATPAQSSVAGSASSVTLLASNANRRGATIFNDSTADLKLKLGATASASSFTALLNQNGYYEVPFGYTGVIDGIWASATGNARITELTA